MQISREVAITLHSYFQTPSILFLLFLRDTFLENAVELGVGSSHL
jgi:hypothetical protein